MTIPVQHTPDTAASTTSRTFFEDKYRQAADPWSFASSPYEQGRYRAILQALGDGRTYGHAFEPGCSIGVLTEQLAARCRRVTAADLSPTAVALARQRCRALPHVSIRCAPFQSAIPDAPLDLVVLSEIGYYCTEPALLATAQQLVARLAPGGTLLACHWLGRSPDHILTGDQVHAALATLAGLTHQHAARHAAQDGGFRLDRWVRA